MKKTSKIVSFFKSIGHFFDRILITPITKLFMGIIKFFSTNGSGIEKILVNRQSIVVISLIFAIVTYVAIDRKHVTLIDNSAEILYNQKVTVNYNEALYVVEGVPETVDLTIVGKKGDVYLAKQYPVEGVVLDLTGYTPGSYQVAFKYDREINSVDYKVDPSSVNIRIYDKVSVTKELGTEVIHKDNLDTKLNIDSIVLDRDNITVKGAKHILEEVAIVKAIIDIDNLSSTKIGTTTLTDVPLIAYDAEGNKMDVEIVPNKVSATIKVTSPNKEIPIKLIPEGELDGVSIKDLKSNIDKVVVYGNQEVIDSITNLPVKVNVQGVKNNKTYTINLTKPTGIREISVKTITVDLTVDPISTKIIKNIPIDTINLGNGLIVQAIGEENRSVEVILNGSNSIIEGIDAAQIKAYIDLEGLNVGEHSVEVKVSGDDTRVTYTPRVKEIKIKISKK
jgi:YbbR domain-containing protein